MRMSEIETSRIDVIFAPEVINRRIGELAREIRALEFDNLLVVAVLKGSFVFAADLIRALHEVGLAPEVDFITLSSYRRGTQSTGKVEILRDVDMDVAGRNVLLVDDILESGRTLAFAKDLLVARGASQVATCVLLKKPVDRAVDIDADIHAFDCPEVFVVGYGMDVAYRYRQLPFVGCIAKD
jgi:hypoxanthine phosphoribosyltransferase